MAVYVDDDGAIHVYDGYVSGNAYDYYATDVYDQSNDNNHAYNDAYNNDRDRVRYTIVQ